MIKPAKPKKFKSMMKNKFDLGELNYLLKELEFGIDVQTNTIFLNSEISTDVLYETISRFNFLMKFSKGAINLNVSSFGGDVYSMFGIHDFIRGMPVKVNTICIGPAMSAAAFLLTSGTGERIVTRNSTIMFHQFSSLMEGKTQALEVNLAYVKKLQGRAEVLLGKYTKKPTSFWKENTKEDFYLSAEEALEFGVVDKVVG